MKKRRVLTFSRKLFLSVVSLFLISVISFITFQYQREKEYKIESLDAQLQNYNHRLHLQIKDKPLISDTLDAYILEDPLEKLRITIVDLEGYILYDSHQRYGIYQANRINRKEIQRALKHGKGYEVKRVSEKTGTSYFCSATLYDRYIIRTCLPYDQAVVKTLRTDRHYIWFTIILSTFLIGIFYQFTRRMGDSLRQLQDFVKRAEQNQPIVYDTTQERPHNELGDISQHIIKVYKRLHQTKEALYIEREKLITHLQIAREGLGIFTKDKKEILVNNLFTQYINLISDIHLQNNEHVFSVPEFVGITNFISRIQEWPIGKVEPRMSITVNKNGKVFIIECIIFQDMSFEISISDVTQQQEETHIKRELTQNIAHELKTPVSSIQGYLETLVNNADIPKEKEQMFLERCYAQSNRLSRLLQDISVLTRMDEAAHLIEMERVNISILISTIINEVSLDLEKRNITVVNSVTKNIQVRGNYSLLYSIFRNLMDNSIVYGGTDIEINISCFREDEELFYFSFADSGVGVSPEHLTKLFDRFYRVDKGRSRKLGGTGLGLAIVKNAVLIHGGTISAKNFQKGGLEFIFTLAKTGRSDRYF